MVVNTSSLVIETYWLEKFGKRFWNAHDKTSMVFPSKNAERILTFGAIPYGICLVSVMKD